MPIKYAFELLVLSAIWGASFLFMRTTSDEFGPIMLVTLRTGLAALALTPFLIYSKLLSQLTHNWLPILFVGLTNTAIPFCLFSYSTLYMGAGHASILNATAPMFAAIIGYLWYRNSLSLFAALGLALGFVGVLVLSLAHLNTNLDNAILPVFAALGATFLYGVAACYAKKNLQGVNTLAIATGSQIFAVLSLAPISLFFWPAENPGVESWWQLIALGLVCTAVAYILYFRLIANVGAEKAITVAYLVPIFGVVWGMIFLQESLTATMIIGAILVLLGVAMSTGLIKLPKRST